MLVILTAVDTSVNVSTFVYARKEVCSMLVDPCCPEENCPPGCC
jgi:hypothetical protein